jgi:glycosyltransferase involved in cell wall biosynthesis
MTADVSDTSQVNLRVTVGLCVKNVEKTIERCLKSVVNQNYPKPLVTLIVVDGKSKDKTVETIKDLLVGSGLKPLFFSDKGAGLGVARQTVFENTCDKYIVWVDGDAVINGAFIRSQVEFMEQHPKVCVATGLYIHKNDVHANLPAAIESIGKHVGSVESLTAKANRGLPPNDVSIYRVDALKQVKGFDKNIRGASEDEDVITRMRKIGWLVAVNPHAEYYVFPRATWQDLWAERVWFGYGQHFLGHKDMSLNVCIYHIPIIKLYTGLKLSIKAYRLTTEKKSFLFPIYNVLITAAWWHGFLKAHLEGYGH